MRETFIPKYFNAKHTALIDTARQIMSQYALQGYDLSLRQLYYQFVAHHALPNTEQSYKMLGGVISDARLAGKLDWDTMVDRGRHTISNSHWDTPADIIESAVQSFRIDLWEGQGTHVEVMVEKQALEGVLVPVCRQWDVPFTSNKGYSSSSAMYSAGKRMKEALCDYRNVVVIYLGDHDPSGIDMTRDVDDRLRLFSGAGYWDDETKRVEDSGEYECSFSVSRVALNMSQIRTYAPPPNPAKMTDSRAGDYVSRFGSQSWELDALDPSVLADLVTSEIRKHIDTDAWDIQKAEMARMKGELKSMAADYRASQNSL